MVHGRPGKRAGALMAGLTGRRGLDMGAWLTFGSAAVMAIGTTAGDTGVVHRRTGKTGSALMAGLASRCSLDMSTWLTLSG